MFPVAFVTGGIVIGCRCKIAEEGTLGSAKKTKQPDEPVTVPIGSFLMPAKS
jgi:hypothetical protein